MAKIVVFIGGMILMLNGFPVFGAILILITIL